jgi:iron complex outermembrane receptor protein/vitamin B12 transporter
MSHHDPSFGDDDSHPNTVTLVLGGARSGKSTYAQNLAGSYDNVLFVATAAPSDDEMRAKIVRHRADRPSHWTTAEEPLALAEVIRQHGAEHDVVLIDCLTLYAANLLHAHGVDGSDSPAASQTDAEMDAAICDLCAALSDPPCAVILVSNEVGSGVVPAYALGRRYRDLLGELNQRVAAVATDAVLMVAGLPLTLKSSGAKPGLPRSASRSDAFTKVSALLMASALLAPALHGQAVVDPADPLNGVIRDPLGAVVRGATVDLLANDTKSTVLATAMSDAAGVYHLPVGAAARYRVRVSFTGFGATESAPTYLQPGATQHVDLTLNTPTLSEQVTVTATGIATPLAQSGAPISVLSADQDFAHTAEVQEPLRLVPGVQMAQTGQTGGTASLFIRGGQSTYNKVLIDGVPVNDIGGDVDFANLANVGIARVEVLRQPNSVLYGSDDLSGVVQLTTARGTTPLPLITYAVDGGNLGTLHQEADISGARNRFDYYTGIGRLSTSNNVVDDAFHNITSAGSYGYSPRPNTDLRLNWRLLDMNGGQPNAIALYGIPDFANQRYQDTFVSATFDQQSTTRWHNLLRYGHQALHSEYTQFAPDGTLYVDPVYGPLYYLGLQETIHGANGATVTGQGILDYYEDYPNFYNTTANRDFVYAQTDYRVNSHLNVLGAFQYAAERGATNDGYTVDPVSEGNYSYTLQAAGDVRSRLFYTVGSGIEDNAVYGKALTPRATLAYYLVRPGAGGLLAGTKLHGSFGKGVKEGSIGEQASSLYELLLAQPNGPALIAKYHTTPLGAEYSRTYDAGVEQQFADGKVRANLTYFHNEFTNGIQYVSQGALVALGIPAASAAATEFGAYVNSQAYRAQGAELELEYRISRRVFARAGYTYLDAVVQRSFSSDALSPSFNTASNFATTPIGVYAPLDGARPFRLAPHSGYFAIGYNGSRLTTQLTGTLVGRRDDSDFLSDPAGDGNLLLPNRNLDGAYQRLALTTDYRINRFVSAYANLENLLNESYQEAFGYPALPFHVRGGIKLSFGGESFRLR